MTEELPKCEEYQRDSCLTMARVRYPDGSAIWRARIYYGPTVDYKDHEFESFDHFVRYCRYNRELQDIAQQSYKQHGDPKAPDWEKLRRQAAEYTEAKRKAEEANQLYEKAVAHMEEKRKSKWIIPGLIRR